MKLDRHICDRARVARDSRFDGLFFFGVRSTGIFCRPVCPARHPRPENIVYFPTAAAAVKAGLRPCRRCRPETAPGSPAWNGASGTVSRALRLIRQGALNEGSIEELAQKLGVGSRQLRRQFQTHVGVSPKALNTTQNILFAKKLLKETDLSVTEIAFASGFGSIRRFNAAFKKIDGSVPSIVRRTSRSKVGEGVAMIRCDLQLPYRPPFDWGSMLDFFRKRAIPGVECVDSDVYQRSIRLKETFGVISMAPAATGHALQLQAFLSDSRDLLELVERVRRLFDLDANMAAILEVLGADPDLKSGIEARPGLRLPGGWDPFEVAVRAVVGQQISVQGARTILGRIAEQVGMVLDQREHPQLRRFFPTLEELGACRLEDLGLTARRQETITRLCRALSSGELEFVSGDSLESSVRRLTRIPGIGDWTAQYIAMRGLGEPDAFPASDLGLGRALQQEETRPTPKEILKRAEKWRPWRAYAATFLWQAN